MAWDPWAIFSTIVTVYIILIVILLILENRDPDKTIAWVLIFIFLPVIGLIIYFYMGQNWKKKNFMRNFQTRVLSTMFKKEQNFLSRCKPRRNPEIKALQKKVVQTIEKTSNYGLTCANNSIIFENGKDKFDQLKKDLLDARKYIHMEYYIIHSDRIGEEIKEILIKKAREGLEVRVLYDFTGSFWLSSRYRSELKSAGVKLMSFFNPFKLFAYHKLNYRTHRKIVVIDGKIAYVGGMNIADEYIHGGKLFPVWRDLHMRVEGEIVEQIQMVFIYDWYLTTKKSIISEKYFPKLEFDAYGDKLLQVAYSGPESEWESIKQVFFLMVSNAKKSVYITSPFFIPDETLYMALKNAALSGVDVRIIVPGKSNISKRIVFNASRTYFEELLKAGVKIYEYMSGNIHAKLMIVDSVVATVGTANFDIRSLQVNFDINLAIYSLDDVRRLEKYFRETMEHSKKLNYEGFRRRKLSVKVKQSLARLLSPVL